MEKKNAQAELSANHPTNFTRRAVFTPRPCQAHRALRQDAYALEGRPVSNGRTILRQHRREREAHERFAPADRSGYVYYVRLDTDVGRLYKLGFTKSTSVQERFGFGGSKNVDLIEKVLCFVHLIDAYDVEGRLHLHFRDKKAFGTFSADPAFPLSGSGQGELYYDDILQIHPEYSALKRFAAHCKAFRKKHHPLLFVVGVVGSVAILVPLSLVGWLARKLLGDSKEPYFNPQWPWKRPRLPVEIEEIISRLRASV